MNSELNRVIALIAIIGLAGCARQSATTSDAQAPLPAMFRFSEKPPGVDQMIEGTVRVLLDTMMVEAQPGPCRRLMNSNSGGGRFFAFQCADVLLEFDRAERVVTGKYSTARTITESRSVCTRYETNTSGQRVCAQTTTEPVERKVRVSGQLHLIYTGAPF